MKVSYYGHSCFSAWVGDRRILFDPFVTGNPRASGVDVDAIKADLICVSHGHADHIADCTRIALRTGAKVVTNWEIAQWLTAKGVGNTHGMNTGGEWDFGFARVKAVSAIHSSSLPDGAYGGNPMGFTVKTSEKSFYYSGDTALTMDMQLVPSFVKPDFLLLPIGDNFTMGYEDAARAAHMIACRTVVGLHYGTFPPIDIDVEVARRHFERNGLDLLLPEIGSTIDI